MRRSFAVFGHFLQNPISPLEKFPHIPGEKQGLGNPAKHTKRGAKFKHVAHQGSACRFFEVMFVADARENSLYHFIHEIPGPIELADNGRETLANSKVPGLPGDCLAGTDQSRGAAGDSLLVRAFRAGHVSVDVARQIEDGFDRGIYVHLKMDDGHDRLGCDPD